MDTRTGMATIVVASIFALVIGVAVGFVTTFTHTRIPPWGLIAGLLICAALVAGFRMVFSSRVIAAAAALGVVGSTALLTLPGAGGTAFVIDGPLGYAWAIGPTVLALIVLAWPNRFARRTVTSDRPTMDS